MRHHSPRPADADFSSAWYLVPALLWALAFGLTFITGPHNMAQPSAEAPAEPAMMPPAA